MSSWRKSNFSRTTERNPGIWMGRKQNYKRQSWILDKKLWRLSNQIQTYYMKFVCTQGYETQKSYCSTKTSIITSRIIDYWKQNSICIIVSRQLKRGAGWGSLVVKLHCFSLMKRAVKSKIQKTWSTIMMDKRRRSLTLCYRNKLILKLSSGSWHYVSCEYLTQSET